MQPTAPVRGRGSPVVAAVIAAAAVLGELSSGLSNLGKTAKRTRTGLNMPGIQPGWLVVFARRSRLRSRRLQARPVAAALRGSGPGTETEAEPR